MSEQNKLGAIICPNCKKLISANSEECMHCGMKNPNLWGFGGVLRKILGGHVSFIPIISVFCIVLFVISLLLDPKAIFQSRGFLDILSASNYVLFRLGATGAYPISQGYWWTVITAIYLHANLIHIFFNIYWIRYLGPPLEEYFGISRSFVIFTVAGALGFIASNAFGIPFTIGASGSNFGLLAALIYYGRKRGGTFGMAIYRQVGQWAIVLFVMGFLFPGVNNIAHAGGFVGGYLTASLLGFNEIKQENRNHHLLAFGAIALTILAFLLAIFSF